MFLGTADAPNEKVNRTNAREAFFLEFARAIRDKFRDVPLVLTGGFRTRQGMEAALQEGACEMVGIGRPAVLNPALPKNIVFNHEIPDADAKLYARRINAPWIVKQFGGRAVGAGAESVSWSKILESGHSERQEANLQTQSWYSQQIAKNHPATA